MRATHLNVDQGNASTSQEMPKIVNRPPEAKREEHGTDSYSPQKELILSEFN